MNENNYYQYEELDYYELYKRQQQDGARRSFSRIGMSLFFYVLVANVVIFIAQLIMMLVMGEAEFMALVESNVYLQFLFSFVSQYICAFPVLHLILRNMKKTNIRKCGMPISEFLSLFLISQVLIQIGAMVGEVFNAFLSVFKGDEITDAVGDLVSEAPLWLTALVVVIIGPIFEELIFRKFIIDRLSRFGTTLAIVASSIAFGLFHGNFYQLFYAVLLGFVLGYIYVKTGDVRYPIVMHMLINLFGSVLTLPVAESMERVTEMMEAIYAGTTVDMSAFLIDIMIVGSYSIINTAMMGGGIAFLIIGIKKRRFKARELCEFKLPRDSVGRCIFKNPGVIMFLSISLLTFISSLFV